MESDIPARRTGLNVREVDQEIVIVDKDSGDVHQLNQTASFIWDLCDGKNSIGFITSQLIEHYGISEAQALQDVAAVIQDLRGLNLLEE